MKINRLEENLFYIVICFKMLKLKAINELNSFVRESCRFVVI